MPHSARIQKLGFMGYQRQRGVEVMDFGVAITASARIGDARNVRLDFSGLLCHAQP
jgi:hypothetical protein